MKKTPEFPVEIREQILTVYRNLVYLKQRGGLTDHQVVQGLGITHAKWRKVEQGIDLDLLYGRHLCNACDLFGVSIDELCHTQMRQP